MNSFIYYRVKGKTVIWGVGVDSFVLLSESLDTAFKVLISKSIGIFFGPFGILISKFKCSNSF